MKTILFFLLIVSGVAQAQTAIQLQKFPYARPLASKVDTIAAFRVVCIRNEIDLLSENQRPEFLIELINKEGEVSIQRNISYTDMQIACQVAGYPENTWPTVIAQSYAAVFAGTKAQKLAVFTSLMAPYNITVKPQ